MAGLRRPILFEALTFPLNATLALSGAVVLVLAGALCEALLWLALDLALLLLLVGVPPVRRHLEGRAEEHARRRALDRLGSDARNEWRSLEASARTAERFSGRRVEVEALLTSFLDIALVQSRVSESASHSLSGGATSSDEGVAALRRERVSAQRRTERSLELLRQQLATTGELVRLACDAAIATECEGAAELWSREVAESCSDQLTACPCPSLEQHHRDGED